MGYYIIYIISTLLLYYYIVSAIFYIYLKIFISNYSYDRHLHEFDKSDSKKNGKKINGMDQFF
jgi:hypothetical protein